VMLLPITLLLPWIVQRRRNTWVGIIIHAVFNAAGVRSRHQQCPPPIGFVSGLPGTNPVPSSGRLRRRRSSRKSLGRVPNRNISNPDLRGNERQPQPQCRKAIDFSHAGIPRASACDTRIGMRDWSEGKIRRTRSRGAACGTRTASKGDGGPPHTLPTASAIRGRCRHHQPCGGSRKNAISGWLYLTKSTASVPTCESRTPGVATLMSVFRASIS
jgi:hypothetical protein